MPGHPHDLDQLARFPLMQALFGRRARRFGLGMEIPSGPLAYTSRHPPVPLSELEKAILVAAATGVSGWHFGVPFGPARPSEHGQFTQRFTGRTGPTAAGLGTPVLFHTDDDGTWLTNTRDARPSRMRELESVDEDVDRILAVCREHTVRLSDRRLDLPAAPGHMMEPNFWMANAKGSTLFMPMGDVSEQLLGILAIFLANGYVIKDDRAKRAAGDLAPFIRSGLLNADRAFPLSVLELSTYEASTMELAFMGHNIVLALQAMGLGGLFFNGVNRWSVLGAFAADGVNGLGFRFTTDERWTTPNPVGLAGHFEALCPPFQSDMRSAVETFVQRRFGPGGAYESSAQGPWQDGARVKGSVTPYSGEFIDCMSTVAQYILDTYGKFPASVPTIALTGYVQAQHIDTEFYDEHYAAGAYLETHAAHMERWHGT
ncbi:MAG TPA: hypothetical protein VK936_02980 [Longimicrobiales bacterium]|nr:hypothetical protein [Longimicrobiales bacterium]